MSAVSTPVIYLPDRVAASLRSQRLAAARNLEHKDNGMKSILPCLELEFNPEITLTFVCRHLRAKPEAVPWETLPIYLNLHCVVTAFQ